MFRCRANARHLILSGHWYVARRARGLSEVRGNKGLCAIFARDMDVCSPGSSGRHNGRGGRAYLRGVAIFADVLGIFGICVAPTWLHGGLTYQCHWHMAIAGWQHAHRFICQGACLVARYLQWIQLVLAATGCVLEKCGLCGQGGSPRTAVQLTFLLKLSVREVGESQPSSADCTWPRWCV